MAAQDTSGPGIRADGAPGFDTSVAHPARIWDYFLGGKDNFAADRAAAQDVLEVMPTMAMVARAGRAFLASAVHYLATNGGISQFLDIGTGLPTANNTHEVAQRVNPQARIVYLDNDPIVLSHARAADQRPRRECARTSTRICGTPRGSCGRRRPPRLRCAGRAAGMGRGPYRVRGRNR